MRDENEIAAILVDIFYNIHLQYGPGLYESVYEELVCLELKKRSLSFTRQKGIRVYHEGVDIGLGFIADIIVENKVIVEIKSVERLAEVHHKQIITYLRISKLKLGLLVNFNVSLIKFGINRKVNNL